MSKQRQLTIRERLALLLGLSYRCRCGAVVRSKWRQEHEMMHDAIREFFSPPTDDDWAAIRTAMKPKEQP